MYADLVIHPREADPIRPIHPILSYPILSCLSYPNISYPSEIFDLTAPKPRSSSSGSDNSWWILWPNVASRRSNRIHHMFIHTYSVYNAQENPIKIQYGLHLRFLWGIPLYFGWRFPFPSYVLLLISSCSSPKPWAELICKSTLPLGSGFQISLPVKWWSIIVSCSNEPVANTNWNIPRLHLTTSETARVAYST